MPIRANIDDHKLQAFVARDHGVVRVATLRQLGMSASMIAHRTRPVGPWQRILPGIVLTSNGRASEVQRAVAAAQYAGTGAIISGLAALRLHGVRGLADGDDAVHVLIPHRRRRASSGWVVLERTRRMPSHTTISGIRCAPTARAVLDATRRQRDIDPVRATIAAVVQQRRATIADLLSELAAGSRHGSRLPRTVLGEMVVGVRSVAEAKVRTILRSAGLPEGLWNHDLYDANGQWLGRPDAIWLEVGVVLEIDSMAWHLSPQAYRKTQARQRRLTKAGLLVIPVAPNAVFADPAGFLAELRATLAAAAARGHVSAGLRAVHRAA